MWGEQDDVAPGDLEWTPGMGVRYFSPIGPIRVDLAYRFASGDQLQVVTRDIEPFDSSIHLPQERLKGPDGTPLDYVESKEDLVLLNPKVLWGDLSPLSLRRFQLHLSIGQAF